MHASAVRLTSPANGTARAGYHGLPGCHDEMVGVDGHLRSHWQTFMAALEGLGLPELTRRWGEVQQLIRENGVTYNVYGDPRGMQRPWQLDPIPLLLPEAEARIIETGLIQRARLLERILADLYGPQQLLREGRLPPELVFGHPGFLRPCHGIVPPAQRFLHLYATDIGRAPDGSIFVLGDRTQAPSGAGYVLENRIVLSRMLPDLFRDCRVQRLALFFRALRDTLRTAAPHNRDNPRIVLLTPGPYNETYFEHAYLARYLGYTLVEGGDLTVRDNRVYLKVLGGLQPVDVILRRLDDDFCDPLELRADSFLGVPGLVQAARAGNVTIANPLGSGIVETPALLAFLPNLCRHLLGEELHLPSVPTWWCGGRRELEHVIGHLDQFVIKPTFASSRFEPIFGDRLSAEKRDALVARMRARPRDFVAQERLLLSTVPVVAGQQLQPRHVLVRAFLTATPEGFAVMPGGLTRVTAALDSLVVSMQQGGGSKDTWILTPGPVSTFSLLSPTVQPVELSRGGNDLPSRAADNLYWLGRYAERTEGLIRLLRGILVRMTEKSGLAEVPELPALLRTLTLQTMTLPGFVGEGAEQRLAAPDDELHSVLFDETSSGSLASTLLALRRVGGTVRDRISTDMWRVVSRITLPAERPTMSDMLDWLDQRVSTLAAFGGLASESMTRGQGWRFLDMGRRLERAMNMIGLIRHTLTPASGNEGSLLEAVLEIADSSMTYRRRYLSSLQTAPVLDLLLADESNPRSLAFQLVALEEDVEHLPREDTQPGRTPEQRIMLSTLTALRLADAEQLAWSSNHGQRPYLEVLLSRLEAELPVLSDTITQHYLSHLQTSRHLASFGPGRPA